MNKEKKLTYGPRDIINISWALFVPLIIQCHICHLCFLFLSHPHPHPCHVLLPFLLCCVVVHPHPCPCCHPVVVVLVISLHPLVPIVIVIVAPLLFHCCALPIFAMPVAHLHKQVLIAVAWVWVSHLGTISW